jgi:hypothetical protein
LPLPAQRPARQTSSRSTILASKNRIEKDRRRSSQEITTVSDIGGFDRATSSDQRAYHLPTAGSRLPDVELGTKVRQHGLRDPFWGLIVVERLARIPTSTLAHETYTSTFDSARKTNKLMGFRFIKVFKIFGRSVKPSSSDKEWIPTKQTQPAKKPSNQKTIKPPRDFWSQIFLARVL